MTPKILDEWQNEMSLQKSDELASHMEGEDADKVAAFVKRVKGASGLSPKYFEKNKPITF